MEQNRKNQLCTLTIEGYGSDGAGVARLNGQVVFVAGALRGETVEAQLLKVNKKAAWARVVRVISPSPARAAPDCPYYPRCGGCRLRHMRYEEELTFKKEKVEAALRRLGGVELPLAGILGAEDTLRYRNKAQFPVSMGKDGVHIGFYRARSHDVIDVESCLLQKKEADAARGAVKEWMVQWQVPPYHEVDCTGLVRHVYARTNAEGQSLLCVLANGTSLPHEPELVEGLRRACPGAVGILLGINTSGSNVILGERYRLLWGQDCLDDTLCGLRFKLSVPSFYQVNRAQTQRLYTKAAELAALTGGETVVDLYCGAGTITLLLAASAGKAIGVEIVPEAIADAKENARRNGVSNVEFLCADAGQAASELARRGLKPDVISVDPPRKGLSQDCIDAIAVMDPQRVVYVSCDPATLGRDTARFREKGYTVRTAWAVDMFPRTEHVETVCSLSKSSGST